MAEQPNQSLQSYIASILTTDDTLEDRVKKYRDYEDGDQPDQLSAKLRERIGKVNDSSFRIQLNVCPTVLGVEADRLIAQGQSVESKTLSAEQIEPLDTALLKAWQSSAFDMASHSFHYGSIRDGDGYLVLEFDTENNQATFHYNKAYDGDFGVNLVYKDVNNPQTALYAFKIWQELDPANDIKTPTERLNIYWDDRVETYIADGSGWRPFMDKATSEPQELGRAETLTQTTQLVRLANPFDPDQFYTAAVQWLTDTGTQAGVPLGIPVVHYAHNALGSTAGVSGLADVVPSLQDNLNMAMVDTMSNSRFSATALTFLAGMPIQDQQLGTNASGQKVMELEAGAVLSSPHPDAKANILIGTNLDPLIANKNDLLKNIATITQTPLVFFNMTGQLPAEGSLQALQESLHFKVIKGQKALGNTYQNVQRYALKMQVAYGGLEISAPDGQEIYDFIDQLDINTNWGESIRTPETDKIEVAKGLLELGIPHEQVYTDALGYSAEKAGDTDNARKEIESAKRNAIVGAVSEIDLNNQQQSGQATVETTNNQPSQNQVNQPIP